MPDGALVTTEDGVAAVAEGIRAAGAFTLDLEFVPENRYVPDLGLVQVGWDSGGGIDALEVAAIDPLAVDPSPVLTLVGDEAIETITHAAQGDLAILAHRFSVHARSLWDTQIAAAFLGYGDQIGYAPLVESTIGVHLEKGSQYTEWLQRPLTDEQLVYALDDVRYLGAIWAQQRAALTADGRLQPVLEECDRLADAASNRPPPEEAYRRVKGWSGCALGPSARCGNWPPGANARRCAPTVRSRACSTTARCLSWRAPRPAPRTACARSAASRPGSCAATARP